MPEMETRNLDPAALEAQLEERRRLIEDYQARELELLDESLSTQAERVQWWEGLITETRQGAQAQQLASYQSLAKSMAGLLGAAIGDQAKIMIPFEIAEATKEFARFLGTRDPAALASSLKHVLAARQYAAAAKTGGGGGDTGGGAAPGREGQAQTPPAGPSQEEAEKSRPARVIVNVGRQVGIVDTYEFARTLIDSINENIADDVILEVAP